MGDHSTDPSIKSEKKTPPQAECVGESPPSPPWGEETASESEEGEDMHDERMSLSEAVSFDVLFIWSIAYRCFLQSSMYRRAYIYQCQMRAKCEQKMTCMANLIHFLEKFGKANTLNACII